MFNNNKAVQVTELDGYHKNRYRLLLLINFRYSHEITTRKKVQLLHLACLNTRPALLARQPSGPLDNLGLPQLLQTPDPITFVLDRSGLAVLPAEARPNHCPSRHVNYGP
jgi:hypothetical protein